MEPTNYRNNSNKSYYINMIFRKLQTFFISTPEAAFLLGIGAVIIILFLVASLFIHLPGR
jgi:hypothetical protein